MKYTDLGDNGPEFKLQSVAEGGFKNKFAEFSGYGNYMRSRAPNVFKHFGLQVIDKEYTEDEDIQTYTVQGDRDSIDQARAYLERSDQFGGVIYKQGVAEGFKNTYNVGDRVDGPMGTGTIVAVSPNINVDGEIKVKLDDPSRAGEDGKERDTFVLNTTQVKHIADEASLAQMRDYFNQADTDSVKVDRNYDAPSKKQNPVGVPPEIQALVNKMYHAGKISPQEFEVLRKFQQKTKINVGIREADKNPYAIGMAQAMKSTGDKPPLKKSTINKAHEIARAIKKDQ